MLTARTPTNCGHRADGGVLNPMAGRQIVQRYPNCRDGHIKLRGCGRRFPPHLESPVPLPSASQPKADKEQIREYVAQDTI